MAGGKGTCKRPADWEKALSVASLREIGYTQEEAAIGAGVGIRTVRRWEASDWWRAALVEGSKRFLPGLELASKKTVLKAVAAGNADIAFKILERRIPELRPPRVHQVNTTVELTPEEYGLLTLDELDRVEAGLTVEELSRLKVLCEQRARLKAESADVSTGGEE